jgi:Asp-tRNA(Asn)/Glu-tRNA(Gln) amidotransferase A subunit family amidase
MGVQGPIARTMEELRLAFASMSKFDLGDPTYKETDIVISKKVIEEKNFLLKK